MTLYSDILRAMARNAGTGHTMFTTLSMSFDLVPVLKAFCTKNEFCSTRAGDYFCDLRIVYLPRETNTWRLA